MTERKRERRPQNDYMTYSSSEEVVILKMQCDTCQHKLANPLVCTKYPQEKPSHVLQVAKKCEKYTQDASLSKVNHVNGAILGHCVGDALGVPVEFSTRSERKQDPVKEMRGYGTWNQPPGTWSDDTSLTLCLADSLSRGYDLADIAQRFVSWYREANYTAHGNVFDIGNATAEALRRLQKGIAPQDAGGTSEFDNGNGSLMRILPLVFYVKNLPDVQERLQIIHDVSSITHGHLRSQIACTIYLEVAMNLLNGMPPRVAYHEMKQQVPNLYTTADAIRELSHFNRILKQNLADHSEKEIQSTGYVVHTLEASLWCLLNSSSYKATVLKAVNLGEDTDTTAAVVGGLAGIWYGPEAIPADWLGIIASKDKIFEVAERLHEYLG